MHQEVFPLFRMLIDMWVLKVASSFEDLKYVSKRNPHLCALASVGPGVLPWNWLHNVTP